MGSWTDLLYLVALLIEVALLCYLEYKIWKTVYTPLNFLMLPYLVVLLITIMLAGSRLGFVEFYYPSIFIWNVGLLIFFLPSAIIGTLIVRNGKSVVSKPPVDSIPQSLKFLLVVMALLFIVHLKSVLGSSAEALGSDEFGEEFSGGGVWGHLRILSLPLLMMSIYYVSKKRWWLWPIILIFFLVSVLNQVKGWVIIPVLAAMAMRIHAGKTRLTAKFLLYVLLGAFLVFFLSYALSILVVQSRGVSDEFMEFIYMHFLHYLTSGTFGWSMDLQLGLPDNTGDFQNIIAQFVNLFKVATGDKELVYPVNPLYFNPGWALTNVRTIFGTLYINSNWIGFGIYVFVLSSLMYLMRTAMVRFNSIYLNTVYFFFCGMLFMGWFDFYFSGVIVIELPIMLLLLWLFEKVLYKSQEDTENENSNNTD